MIDDRTKMLATTVNKLFSRGARRNIQKILVKTHKADVAALLENLEPGKRYEVFLLEPSFEKRAGILSYLEKDVQRDLLASLSKDEVLRLVSLMDRDDAADLLGHLSEDESKEILAAMVREDSEEVADLMGYPDDSAGGLMSSDYFALKQNLTVRQAIEVIQSEENEGRITFYLYVVNDNENLIGVISLKQLLLSKQSDLLKEIMYTDVISVTVDTYQDEVAKAVERYDFLSIPVVDKNNVLVGVITVDDVIDVIREEAQEDLLAMGRAGWGVDVSAFEHFKARFPWLGLAFLGGSFAFAIVYFFGFIKDPNTQVGQLWLMAAFIPLIIAMGGTTGSQAATVAVGAIRSGKFDVGKVKGHLKKEFKLSLIFALIFGILVIILGQLLFADYGLNLPMAAAMATQIIIAMAVGSTIPIFMQRAGLDPTIASVPLFTTVADLTAMAVLFGFYSAA